MRPDVNVEHPLHVLAGDFQGDGLLPWLGDCVSEVFYGGETDLVVNTPSMSGGAQRERGIRQKSSPGRRCTHFSYFRRDESALALLAALAGDDSGFQLLEGPSRAAISRGGKRDQAQGRRAHRLPAAGHHGQPRPARQGPHLVRSPQHVVGRHGAS